MGWGGWHYCNCVYLENDPVGVSQWGGGIQQCASSRDLPIKGRGAESTHDDEFIVVLFPIHGMFWFEGF